MEPMEMFLIAVVAVVASIIVGMWWDARPADPAPDPHQDPDHWGRS